MLVSEYENQKAEYSAWQPIGFQHRAKMSHRETGLVVSKTIMYIKSYKNEPQTKFQKISMNQTENKHRILHRQMKSTV